MGDSQQSDKRHKLKLKQLQGTHLTTPRDGGGSCTHATSRLRSATLPVGALAAARRVYSATAEIEPARSRLGHTANIGWHSSRQKETERSYTAAVSR